MSRLEQLIEELCPNGVEYKKIKDISKVIRGKRLTKKELDDNAQYPVFHGGLEPLGYYSQYNRNADTTMIINVGASAGTVGYSGVDFWSSDGCYCIERNNCLNNKYLYYVLSKDNNYFVSKVRYAGIPTLDAKIIEEFDIPLPSLPVQSEIVRILDNFMELTSELTSELAERKKQYTYYSTLLFDNAKKSGIGAIKDVCYIEKGKTPIQKAIPGEYPMVVTTTERKSCISYQFDTKAVCIPLVSSRGHGVASLNHVYYQEGKFALGNILCALIPKDEAKVFPKYLYYYFEQTKDYTLVPLMKGGANVALHMKDIEKLKIPIPPLSEQQHIVNILDRFDSLCNDITNGLPAEIDERQKQYEYYRDKLLTFRKLM